MPFFHCPLPMFSTETRQLVYQLSITRYPRRKKKNRIEGRRSCLALMSNLFPCSPTNAKEMDHYWPKINHNSIFWRKNGAMSSKYLSSRLGVGEVGRCSNGSKRGHWAQCLHSALLRWNRFHDHHYQSKCCGSFGSDTKTTSQCQLALGLFRHAMPGWGDQETRKDLWQNQGDPLPGGAPFANCLQHKCCFCFLKGRSWTGF